MHRDIAYTQVTNQSQINISSNNKNLLHIIRFLKMQNQTNRARKHELNA